MTKEFRKVGSCRICGNKSLIRYLDLGRTPLANAIIKKEDADKDEKTYPLEVMFCPGCFLSQLSIVVNPTILFSQYPYRSSISMTFVEHCREIAVVCRESFGLKESDLIVDIASNDGCLLHQFSKEGFHNVLGVDPAENLANIANKAGVETINAFWTTDIAERIVKEKGHSKIITAMNVFAHVDDLNEFVAGIKRLLAKDGIFIIEAPHALHLIKNTEFDTVYHEHLSYLLARPLEKLFAAHDMKIFRIDETKIHGGSIRVFASHVDSKHTTDKSVAEIAAKEKECGLYDIEGYRAFSKNVENIKHNLVSLLKKIKREGKTVAAYGASAKGNTLLNYCGIRSDTVQFIADDTPEKQGSLAPGSRIPIVESRNILARQPDYLLLLAWNFARELARKTESYEKKGGRYIIPIPEVKVVTSSEIDNA